MADNQLVTISHLANAAEVYEHQLAATGTILAVQHVCCLKHVVSKIHVLVVALSPESLSDVTSAQVINKLVIKVLWVSYIQMLLL